MVSERIVSPLMDRAEAATTLLLWQMEGGRDLPSTADHGEDRTLVSLVNEESRRRPPPAPPRPSRPKAPDDFLSLDEEALVRDLRTKLGILSHALNPEEYDDLRTRLGPDQLPLARIMEISEVIDRLEVRAAHGSVQRDLEVGVAQVRPSGLKAILLFSRDGRLLAEEGDTSGFDMTALSALVARAESGVTWSLANRAGFLVGHGGGRTALIALFKERPPKNVPLALRASVTSLEQRRGLLDSSQALTNQIPLNEYIRAVRLLLLIETS